MENLIKTSCKQNGSLTYAFFDFCCLFALFGINNKIIKIFFAMIVGLSSQDNGIIMCLECVSIPFDKTKRRFDGKI